MIAATTSSGGSGFTIIFLVIIVFYIVGFWKLFTKAGQPGWGAIIPVYNIYLYCKIAGRPGWWIFLFLIPIVNIIVGLILAMDVAKNFGKSSGFGIGLWILGFIFVPILAFGSAQYAPIQRS
ncbi:MAG TPA: DUF5684 domain-containing protein [Acidimicrobiales bacterium]